MSDADFQRGERVALRWAAREARTAADAIAAKSEAKAARGAVAALLALADAIDPEPGGMASFGQASPSPAPSSTSSPPIQRSGGGAADVLLAPRSEAKSLGYTRDECSECGSMQMVRNGMCLKCENCGATTGCS